MGCDGVVFNQSRAIVTQASGHYAVFTEPDVCYFPPPAKSPTAPFPNFAPSTNLVNGTSSASVGDAPVWTTAGWLTPSEHDAGQGDGINSGTRLDKAEPLACSRDVFVESNAVVRSGDPTWQNHRNTVGIVTDKAGLCAALWGFYQKEAQAIIAPAGNDPILRNQIINGAWANLYLQNPTFKWVGMAAYASKQVGCGMRQAEKTNFGSGDFFGLVSAAGQFVGDHVPGWEFKNLIADHVKEVLGDGNKGVFLDSYPAFRFYAEQGFDRMNACSCERHMDADAIAGFAALNQYDKTKDPKYLDEEVANQMQHEQVNFLQKHVFSDAALKQLLEWNQEKNPGSPDIATWLTDFNKSPMTLVMGTDCSGGPYEALFPGTDPSDPGQRMDWIMGKAVPLYNSVAGSDKHKADLQTFVDMGRSKGGVYPP